MASPRALDPHEIISPSCPGSHSAFPCALFQPKCSGKEAISASKGGKRRISQPIRGRGDASGPQYKVVPVSLHRIQLRTDQSGFLQTMTAKCDCEAFHIFFFVVVEILVWKVPVEKNPGETSTFGRDKHQANPVGGANTWLGVLSLNHERRQALSDITMGRFQELRALPHTLWAEQAEEANDRLVNSMLNADKLVNV